MYKINYDKISNMLDKFVVLKIYLTDLYDLSTTSQDSDIFQKYLMAVEKQQNAIVKYVEQYFAHGSLPLVERDLETGISENIYLDAGFDLFVPNAITFESGETHRIDMGVKCSMTYNGVPCSYYIYPRSSTGAKTPLRLANSVGIIDAGYRGNLMAVFDNVKNNSWQVDAGDRLLQICSGNLHYPIFPIIVDSVEELGITERGTSGFGSSGR